MTSDSRKLPQISLRTNRSAFLLATQSARNERTLQDFVYSRVVIFTVTRIMQFNFESWDLKAFCQALVVASEACCKGAPSWQELAVCVGWIVFSKSLQQVPKVEVAEWTP
jgi:hypothetical protein